MSYCEVEDLLIGQVRDRLPPQVVPNDFIEAASDEIDSKLGFMYVTPFMLDQDRPNSLPVFQAKLIKDICKKLASGRILLAATSAMEQSTIHAYGASLIRDATVSLMAIANGDARLSVIRVDADGNPRASEPDSPEVADPFAFIPGARNRDTRGGVEAFEDNYMTPSTLFHDPWVPGDA